MLHKSKEDEPWTFDEVENNQHITNDFTNNLRHNECLNDTETLTCTGNNVKAEKMEQNCTVLRAKSLKFFEDSKFKRECEWTSSYFAKKNSEDLQPKDKDLNGNYGHIAIRNKTEASSSILCENVTPPLSKFQQNGKPNGIPVLEQQGGHGTSDSFKEDSSRSCDLISDNTSITSAYKDIKHAGHDMKGYVSPKEGNIASCLHRERFDRFSSHDTQPSRKNPQDIKIPMNTLNKEVLLWDKKSTSRTSSGLYQDAQDVIDCRATAMFSQADIAKSLKVENHVREKTIVPVSIQRQSVCCGVFFEESFTLEENRRISPDQWNSFDGDQHDETVVIAVCDDDDDNDDNDGNADAVSNDNRVIVNVNHDQTDVFSNNIRVTKWHDDEGCHGDDMKMLLVSYHCNDLDTCHGNVTGNSASDADEKKDADAGSQEDSSKGILLRSGAVDVENDVGNDDDYENEGDGDDYDDDEDDDGNDDDYEDDDDKIENGGNPFDLEESEYQKLMQALDDSIDSLLDDDHQEEPSIDEEHYNTGNPFVPSDWTNEQTKSTDLSTYEENDTNTKNEEVFVNELSLEQMKTPFDDESECNDLIREESFCGLEDERDDGSKCDDNEMKNPFDESVCDYLVGLESFCSSEDDQDDGRKCDDNQRKKFEEQIENHTKENELESNYHHVPTESAKTRDSYCAGHDEVERNFIGSLEKRTDAGFSGLDLFEEHPFDVNLLVKKKNGLLDDSLKAAAEKENCRDELEDISQCCKAVLEETSSHSIDALMMEDGKNDEEDDDEKQQERDLPHVETFTKTADVHMKNDGGMKEVPLPEDQDQQDPSQSRTIPVIVEPSTPTREDARQCSMDGNDFVSLLESYGILTPQSSQGEQFSSDYLFTNEDSTKDLSLQDRIQNVNKAFEWVRKELQEMLGIDSGLKVQFDGLRQEARSLREEYELFVNCEYYDDDEIFDEAAEYKTCQRHSSDTASKVVQDDSNQCMHSKPLLHNGIREDNGYHSDTPSSSTDTGSTDNDKPQHTTHAHAKYYYQPQPTHPKIQELTSGKCVFELVL